MERTLEIMEAELEATRELLKPLQKQLEPLHKKINELEREIQSYKLENAAYHPMSELINYKGKEVRSITLVERNRDGKLTTDYMYNDEIFEITDNGHLYYSSYEGGVMRYSEETNRYIHHYWGHGTPHEYLGFLEIELEDED